MRDARRPAQPRQLRLVRDPPGQLAGLLRQQIRGRQLLAQPAHRDRARVVHRDQHGGPLDARGDPQQHRRDVGVRGPRVRRRMQLPDEPRMAYGTSRHVRDEVDLDPGAAERAHGTQRSVVKGIPVDPQQHCGDAGVEQGHGAIPSVRSPVRASGPLESRNGGGVLPFRMTYM